MSALTPVSSVERVRALGGERKAQHSDLQLFQQVFDSVGDPSNLLRPSVLTNSRVPVLSDLSDHFSKQKAEFGRKIDAAMASQNPSDMVKVTAQMSDQSVESELVAKLVGKTVSGVEQLTKL